MRISWVLRVIPGEAMVPYILSESLSKGQHSKFCFCNLQHWAPCESLILEAQIVAISK